MKFRLEIDCNPSELLTVAPEHEAAMILAAVADQIRSGLVSMCLHDTDGIEVGRAEFCDFDDDGKGGNHVS